jgi:hypothetical protein
MARRLGRRRLRRCRSYGGYQKCGGKNFHGLHIEISLWGPLPHFTNIVPPTPDGKAGSAPNLT